MKNFIFLVFGLLCFSVGFAASPPTIEAEPTEKQLFNPAADADMRVMVLTPSFEGSGDVYVLASALHAEVFAIGPVPLQKQKITGSSFPYKYDRDLRMEVRCQLKEHYLRK